MMGADALAQDWHHAALEYSRVYGFKVFPLHEVVDGRCTCREGGACKDTGKHPRTRRGVKDASCDPQTIDRWWQRWPNSNIAIATGRASGIVVLDDDPAHDGDRTLALLEREHGSLTDTVTSLTGGGGRHLLFRHPGHVIRNSTGSLGPGLDVRGDGGYIVGPPSYHWSGRQYRWDPHRSLGQVEIAELPAWLFELLTRTPRRKRADAQVGTLKRHFQWSDVLDGVEEVDGTRCCS